MERKIVDFYKDEKNEWKAELECGHTQHVRHNPPFINRSWVTSKKGRKNYKGHKLDCKKCEKNQY